MTMLTVTSPENARARLEGADDPPTSPAVAVSCVSVNKIFADGTVGLDSVDLLCPAGKITVLLGPSGCGKTTLLRCIAGLETASNGRITIGESTAVGASHARRDVAMVFQNYALYPSKSVYGNLEFPLRMMKVPRRERRERVEAVASLLHIDALLNRNIGQLSGGQRQRVGIGRALVRRPSVLLMDEPLSNLDAEMRVRMRSELQALQLQLGTTLVFVTHDQAEALALADQLVVMRRGRIEQAAAAETIYAKPDTTFVASFLGAMNILPGASDRGQFLLAGSGEPVLTLPGSVPSDVSCVGIRQEDLRPGQGSPSDVTFHGQTVLTELLGRERLVHFRLCGEVLRAKVHVTQEISSTFTCHVAVDDLHFFDGSGVRY